MFKKKKKYKTSISRASIILSTCIQFRACGNTPTENLPPRSCLHFQQRINFSVKVIIYSLVDVILLRSFTISALSQLSPFIIPLEGNTFRHSQHLLCLRPSLFIRFGVEFSHPNILPCPLFSPPQLPHRYPPPPPPPTQGLMGAQQYKFPFIPVAGADDTAALYPTD